jgi:hypothetical protein
MAVYCSSLISCFPGTWLRYCLSDFEIVSVAPVITGITFALLLLLLLYYYYYYYCYYKAQSVKLLDVGCKNTFRFVERV